MKKNLLFSLFLVINKFSFSQIPSSNADPASIISVKAMWAGDNGANGTYTVQTQGAGFCGGVNNQFNNGTYQIKYNAAVNMWELLNGTTL
ncbi:MAG: hypothetical protein ACK452_02885, partial [Bacteroidota bacterium]